MVLKRFVHQALARLAARWPALSDRLVASFRPRVSASVPWCSLTKPLVHSKIAIVTTAGIHRDSQQPFDMNDSLGDPSFRVIDSNIIEEGYSITHDYYDHRDADRDLNVVFPITRLKEMHAAGCIGSISAKHISFMGHVDGHHVQTLISKTAPQAAHMLKEHKVDAVLLTPA